MVRPPSTRERSARTSSSEVHPHEALTEALLPGAALWAVPVFTMVAMALIILAMSPYTFNLDDIKLTLFLLFGPVIMLGTLWGIAYGVVALPPKIVGWGLAAYVAVCVASILQSDYPWIGWIMMDFIWAATGFFLGGLAMGSTRATAHGFLVFVGITLLFANLFGFFQYDIFGQGTTGVTKLYHFLYPPTAKETTPTPLQHLLYTFMKETPHNLMSTILNRDFYAGFCLLYAPFVVALALTSKRLIWRALGVATTLMSLISIFLCQSKGEYFVAVASVLFFCVLYVLLIRHGLVRGGYLAAWVGGIAILLAAFLFINSPTLMGQLKTVRGSFASREIMFAGAWRMFLQFPILGGGLGTYRIYFPRFRSVDYSDHEISHVTTDSHNYFLDILSETGLLGLAAYTVFAAAIAFFAFRSLWRVKDPEYRIIMIAALCGLLGIYGNNFSSRGARCPIGAVGLWPVLGFTVGLIRQADGWLPVNRATARRTEVSSWPGLTGWPKWGKWALGLLAVLGGIGLIHSSREGIRYWAGSKAYNDGKKYLRYVQKRAIEAYAETEPEDPKKKREYFDERQAIASFLTRSSTAFQKAIQAYPEHESAYYQLGSVENFLSKFKPAEFDLHLNLSRKAYETLSELDPDYAELHYNLGIIYDEFRRLTLPRSDRPGADGGAGANSDAESFRKKTQEHFETMAERSNRPEIYQRLVETYKRLGDYKRAQEAVLTGLKNYPDNEILIDYYYRNAIDLNDQRQLIDAQKRMWLLAPGEIHLIYGGGKGALDLAESGGHADLFEEVMKLALERNPVDRELLERKAKFEATSGNKAEAVNAALAYAKLGGLRVDVLTSATQIARESGNSVAQKALQDALDRSAARP